MRRKKKATDDLPDLKDKDVQDAASKIQAAFKGHRVRMTVNQAVFKAKQPKQDEDLPDLKDKNVADATLKIQSAFRGFQTRKEMKQQKEVCSIQTYTHIHMHTHPVTDSTQG